MKSWANKREKQIMERFKLKPQPSSGAGWIRKEDGENDEILCQLKSTKGKSITVKFEDVMQLIYEAKVAHKAPVFMLDFVEHDVQLVCIFKGDIKEIKEWLTN